MNLFNIFTYFIIFTEVIGFNIITKKVKLKDTNLQNFHNDLEKMSLLSKIIYDTDYNEKNKKEELENLNLDSKINFIRCDNFNCVKFDYLELLSKSEYYKNHDSKNRLQSIILINHDLEEIIVIFRGSIYLDEWMKNLDIKEVELEFNKKFKIHRGIYQMYKENNLFLKLGDLYKHYPKYRKIFTGHSRGSVNSILSVFELDSKLYEKYNYEIFGFGTPPIFNFLLGDYLNKKSNIKIYNVVNNEDIITLLNLKNRFHIGEEVLLDKNNIFIKKHNSPYSINNGIKFTNFFKYIENHNLCNYIENIISKK
jgi:hypothetical protein